MRAFTCGHCDALLFFENSQCLTCGREQGFLASALDLRVLADDTQRCANASLARCNWIVEDDDPSGLCGSCRLTRTRPADSDPTGLTEFALAESAKRRLIFQLLDLGLPLGPDLGFELLSSEQRPVSTGHADGLITLDLAESDDVDRERRRAQLGEPYRTVLGHFRHEIGHYFWPRIVEADAGRLERCRTLFGDEREDYGEALSRHYETGPPADWHERFVSAYATMHPWEDWAETFAHYLHIRDTIETAAAFGIIVAGPAVLPATSLISAPAATRPDRDGWEGIIATWFPLTLALNAVNRSMGAGDLYPFTLAPAAIDKLAFVHSVVAG